MNVRHALQTVGHFFVRSPKPAAKPDTLALRIRWNGLANRTSNIVHQLETFAREYLTQAVEAKRTGDTATLAALRNQFAAVTVKRREMEHLLHGIRFVSTNLSVRECLVDFYGVLRETSLSLDGELSPETIAQAEDNFTKVLRSFQNESARMDRILQVMDAGMAASSVSAVSDDPQRDAAFDAAVSDLAAKRDSSVETTLKVLLQRS